MPLPLCRRHRLIERKTAMCREGEAVSYDRENGCFVAFVLLPSPLLKTRSSDAVSLAAP